MCTPSPPRSCGSCSALQMAEWWPLGRTLTGSHSQSPWGHHPGPRQMDTTESWPCPIGPAFSSKLTSALKSLGGVPQDGDMGPQTPSSGFREQSHSSLRGECTGLSVRPTRGKATVGLRKGSVVWGFSVVVGEGDWGWVTRRSVPTPNFISSLGLSAVTSGTRAPPSQSLLAFSLRCQAAW